MNKVLIVEDRTTRKEQFLSDELKAELLHFNDFVTFMEGEAYTTLKKELNSKNLSSINEYSVIIVHRSAFNHSILDYLKEHCKNSNKPLVQFSGGVSSSYFDRTSGEILTINSRDFYSSNLIAFLSKIKNLKEIEIPIIQYGANWELNYLMKTRNLLANYLYSNPEVKQTTRNQIINSIQLDIKVLLIFDKNGDYLSWLENGISEDAHNKLTKMLNIIEAEITERISNL